MTKRIYFFGNGEAEGRASMKNLLGGKGANLAEMTAIGVPVPPGFTITTETCTEYQQQGDLPAGLMEEVKEHLARVEALRGKRFGDVESPLLFSVRSGSRVSMPGMMDTVLNIGLNDLSVEGLARTSGDARFAWDSYRRLLQMYSDVVMGLERHHTEKLIEARKAEKKIVLDTDLSADDWRDLATQFKAVIEEHLGRPFPQDPEEQLVGAIKAVFESWNLNRAKIYRRNNNIPEDWGTAVNVQSMVFGNLGNNCATGVAFTRDPADGTNLFFGEFLVNAQGEDVVAGIRTPQLINRAKDKNNPMPTLEEVMPAAYAELNAIRNRLESHYKDMQDIEFTIENGKLWMLQTRGGKRTIFAAIRIATDMVAEGLIDTRTAVKRVSANELPKLFSPILNSNAKIQAEKEGLALTRGLAASPGGAAGRLVLDPDKAQEWAAKGDKVLLTRIETSPEDIGGMSVAQGILTARGGMTSHAAVVARGMGVPCVSGAGDLQIDYDARTVKVGAHLLHEGDLIALDGFDGRVYKGEVEVQPSEILQVLNGTLKAEDSDLYRRYEQIMTWSDELKVLGVRTNADTPHDATMARKFGATGIGLCRTEHMFFGGDRILHVREMILADNEQGRRAALAKILAYQREDFVGILGAMHGLPVTIRLLDPPLHEFLPHEAENQAEVAKEMGVTPEVIKQKVEALHEFNPMLGHRGCRLGISMPEITEMQSRAIFEAAVELTKQGVKVFPEVMVPLVGTTAELTHQKTVVNAIAEQVFAEQGMRVDYLVGTMIEVPRAALTAADVAKEAQFFSFGTNDLTQMTFGYSRDDAGKFLKVYTERDSSQWAKYMTAPILPNDPFQVLDREGVGQLVALATNNGRKAREEAGLSRLKVGICGEHGGEPSSVEFCHMVGLDYVSCSPYRVPVARLAAAQAAI